MFKYRTTKKTSINPETNTLGMTSLYSVIGSPGLSFQRYPNSDILEEPSNRSVGFHQHFFAT